MLNKPLDNYNKEKDVDINEYELNRARSLCEEVKRLASLYDLEFFFVTEGASCCNIKNNEAVRNARTKHEEWEVANGFDPKHDWSENNAK